MIKNQSEEFLKKKILKRIFQNQADHKIVSKRREASSKNLWDSKLWNYTNGVEFVKKDMEKCDNSTIRRSIVKNEMNSYKNM